MKTATVRELRNHYTRLLKWIEAGEEIAISRRGVVIARLIPEPPPESEREVSWEHSAAVGRNRKGARRLGARQSAKVRADSQGNW